MVYKVVYLNEKNVNPQDFKANTDRDITWYLDNGAINHIIGGRNYFKSVDESITGKVSFSDDSCIDIKGKCQILFCRKYGGKKILADVYYIPDLKSNIISLNQATKSGCDASMKEDFLVLKDRDGKLITRAKRSKNLLYKVLIDMVDEKCVQLSTLSNFEVWHARLGHIGRESRRLLINKELVIVIPKITIEKETFSSCLLGKQERAKTFFPTSNYLPIKIHTWSYSWKFLWTNHAFYTF